MLGSRLHSPTKTVSRSIFSIYRLAESRLRTLSEESIGFCTALVGFTYICMYYIVHTMIFYVSFSLSRFDLQISALSKWIGNYL